MGAYLSQPVTKKVSSDGGNEFLTYGDSSMQGWRVSQEDAHNSIPDFLPGCSLFAVYDGHGGHEVAAYTAEVLPSLIREHPLYKSGHVRDGLRQAFLEFDQTLTRQEVIEKLKAIAGRENDSEDDEEEETDREVDELFQEAHMPLDQLMAKYTGGGEKTDKPAAGGVTRVKGKEKEKVLSPFLRAKAGRSGSSSGSGSSSSADDGAGSVSSSSSSSPDNTVRKDLSAEIIEAAESDVKANARKEAEVAASDAEAVEEDSKTSGKSESCDSSVESESNEAEPEKKQVTAEVVKSEVKRKTNGSDGSGDADSTDAFDSQVTEEKPGKKPDEAKETVPADGGGDSKPLINGDKTAENGNSGSMETPDTTEDSAQTATKKGGKGARPGSGKSPATADVLKTVTAAAKAQKPTRKMPERAAAEIYRDVLAGARLAKETGVVEDEVEEEEEEEEVDEDFSMEQSDSVGDEDGEEEAEEEEEEEEEEDSDDAQEDGEEAVDEEDFMINMKDEPGSDSGCTAVVALLHGRHLYVANIGDSRCVLSRSGRAVDMSADHKPEDEPELQRILKAGGKVTMDGRVNGGLNLSRAFGDHAYKTTAALPADQQMISASPDVRRVTIEPETDEFMVLACDGIWNSKGSQEVVDFVSERVRERGETQLSNICEELFIECLAENTMGDGTGCDNMTCIIVSFSAKLANVQAPPIALESAPTSESVERNGDAKEEERDEEGENGEVLKQEADGNVEAGSNEAKREDAGESKHEGKTAGECDAGVVVRQGEELADQPPGKRQRVE